MFNTITFETIDSNLDYKFFVIKDRYFVKKIRDDEITTCTVSRKSFESILKQQEGQVMIESVDEFYNGYYETIDDFLTEALESFLDFCEDINKEQNERTFNQILIKNTKNNITKTFPTELIDMIINFC